MLIDLSLVLISFPKSFVPHLSYFSLLFYCQEYCYSKFGCPFGMVKSFIMRKKLLNFGEKKILTGFSFWEQLT